MSTEPCLSSRFGYDLNSPCSPDVLFVHSLLSRPLESFLLHKHAPLHDSRCPCSHRIYCFPRSVCHALRAPRVLRAPTAVRKSTFSKARTFLISEIRYPRSDYNPFRPSRTSTTGSDKTLVPEGPSGGQAEAHPTGQVGAPPTGQDGAPSSGTVDPTKKQTEGSKSIVGMSFVAGLATGLVTDALFPSQKRYADETQGVTGRAIGELVKRVLGDLDLDR